MAKAKFSAWSERSIGIGAMGWHGYLMRKGIPFESALAVGATHRIFKNIKEKALEQSTILAKERGEPADLIGYGVRNANLLAIAPNANSSILCNCTPSIEPISSNAYAHRTRAGTHLVKNNILEETLLSLGKNTEETWSSIINNEGSVQHLPFLSDYVKDVFKTFKEIDQHWVTEQGGHRQKYLCQGQSVNLYFPDNCPRAYINSVHLSAWREGLKGLYYVRTSSGAVADKVGVSVERKPLSSFLEDEGCLSCEG
jgi:ribonucleoside-diphosphate reductase alpha chain